MRTGTLTLALLIGLAASIPSARAGEGPGGPGKPVLRLGAVASSPDAVTVFEGLCRYLDRHGLPAGLLDHARGLPRGLELEIGGGDPGALAREGQRRRAADAGAGPGHERGFAGQHSARHPLSPPSTNGGPAPPPPAAARGRRRR
jgi:hypothetical protein